MLRNDKNAFFGHPTVFDAQLLRNPLEYLHHLIPPESRLRGLHFCRWQYASIFFQIFVAGSERRTIDIAQCVLTLQGHPRSMIFMSSERAYATFYWWSIVTLALSLTVSEIRRLIGWKSPTFPTPPLFNPKFENVPFAVDRRNLACSERRHWAN